MNVLLTVEASEADVRAELQSALSAEEFALIAFEQREPIVNSFEPPERGEAVTFLTVVIWTAQAVAGGIIGGIAYDASKKATAALIAKFGKDRVAADAPSEE